MYKYGQGELNMDEKIAERLAKLRKEHNFSQEQLADELGVSRQAISKWERGETSPDTDNLIALAKLYNTSLDELLWDNRAEEKKSEEKKDDISLSEIKRKIENGEEVEVNGEIHTMDDRSHMDKAEGFVASVTVVLSCVVYFLLGGIWGLWHPGWIVFFAIPITPTIVGAIEKKDPRVFCYPVLVTAVYLLLGCQWGLWHPWWVIFLSIPVYYIICNFFKKS